MYIVLVPAPSMRAPAAFRKFARLTHLGLHRGVFDDGDAAGVHGGGHQLLRRACAGHIEVDARAY
jgi:hypothetical protein